MPSMQDFLAGLGRAYGGIIPPSIKRRFDTPSDSGGLSAGQPPPAGGAELGPYQSGPSPYSPEGMSKMLDLKKLGLLFDKAKTDPGAAAQLRGLGPGLTETAGPPSSSIRTSDPAPQALPEAHRVGPQAPLESTGDKFDIHGVDQPRKGTDWKKILQAANIGFTDLGNALSDSRQAQGGGAIYDLNKAQMAEEQVAKLRTRQSMFDESYKVSQSLPPEVLTDPQFAELKQAKDAMDKDAADGQIDDENTVTKFNMAFTRAKHTLMSREALRKDTEQLESNKRMAGGNLELQLGQRGELERIAADPTNPMSAVAQQELAKLKLSDIQNRNVGGQDVSMSASDWAKHDIEDPYKQREMGQRDRALDISASNQGRDDRERAAYRSQGALGSMLESSLRRYSKVDPDTGTALNPEQALGQALEENQDAIMQAAQRAGVPFQTDGQSLTVNGRTFDLSNPAGLSDGLKLLYQMTRT